MARRQRSQSRGAAGDPGVDEPAVALICRLDRRPGQQTQADGGLHGDRRRGGGDPGLRRRRVGAVDVYASFHLRRSVVPGELGDSRRLFRQKTFRDDPRQHEFFLSLGTGTGPGHHRLRLRPPSKLRAFDERLHRHRAGRRLALRFAALIRNCRLKIRRCCATFSPNSRDYTSAGA